MITCVNKAANSAKASMTGPAISVAMSVYNGGVYLPAAIESILGQTFTDFEFLILNDGSSDDSAQIIKSYAASDSVAFTAKTKALLSA